MIGTDVQNYFGPKLKVICDKFQIKFNETDLLRKNQTREQILSLVAKDISILDKIFSVQTKAPFQNPLKDIDEQAEVNNKEANKNKRIGAIINYLIREGLMEEAVAMYLYRKKMKAINAYLKRLRGLQEAERYAEQVAIFETERMQLQEQMRMALEAELARLDKVHDDLFASIQSHMKAIEEIDEKLEALNEEEDILIIEFGNSLGDTLVEYVPEASQEELQEFGRDLFMDLQVLNRENIELECQNEHYDNQIAVNLVELDADEQYNQLVHSINNHPHFVNLRTTPNTNTAMTAHYDSTNIRKMISDPAQRQKLLRAQQSDTVLQLFEQLSSHEDHRVKLSQDIDRMRAMIHANFAKINENKAKSAELPKESLDRLLDKKAVPPDEKEKRIKEVLPRIMKGVREGLESGEMVRCNEQRRDLFSDMYAHKAAIEANLKGVKEAAKMSETTLEESSRHQTDKESSNEIISSSEHLSYRSKLESKKQQISEADEFLRSLVSQPDLTSTKSKGARV